MGQSKRKKIDDPFFILLSTTRTTLLLTLLSLPYPKLTLITHPIVFTMAGSKVKTQMFVPSVPRVPGYKKSKAKKSTKNQKPSLNQDGRTIMPVTMITTIPTILYDDSEADLLPVGGLSPSRRRILETL
jgi:hypothetical protein